MAELENATVTTESDVHSDVTVELSTHWARIHISEETELWVPQHRIERIEVGR